MAMSSTVAYAGTNTRTFDVIASADADSGDLVITHGLGAAPVDVTITPLLGAGGTANWSVKTITSTTITITKNSTAAGSGNAAAQLRVTARLPHSLVA